MALSKNAKIGLGIGAAAALGGVVLLMVNKANAATTSSSTSASTSIPSSTSTSNGTSASTSTPIITGSGNYTVTVFDGSTSGAAGSSTNPFPVWEGWQGVGYYYWPAIDNYETTRVATSQTDLLNYDNSVRASVGLGPSTAAV